jgi:hypothetical protein
MFRASSAPAYKCIHRDILGLKGRPKICTTYMHIQSLPVTPISADNSRHDHELVLRYEISYASFVLRGIVFLDGVNVKFEG